MRAPDLHAPRFRYDFKDALDLDLVSRFKKRYPAYSDYSNEVLMEIIRKHNKAICKEVINNRDGIELQSGLGFLFIGMTPPSKKKQNIAWSKSIKLGIKVFHKNYETDNKIAKIYYSNYTTRHKFESRHLWGFTAVRQFKREVAHTCSTKWTTYLHMDPSIHIWELFDRRMYRDKARSRTKKELETYNEFDIE